MSGCGGTPVEYGPPPVEYGMPYAKYRIDGNVTKSSNQQPIKGIELTFVELTTISSDSGTWKFEPTNAQPCGGDFPPCSLFARDIDGEENGGYFLGKTVPLDMIKTEDGSGWYVGKFEQHDISIELDSAGSRKDD